MFEIVREIVLKEQKNKNRDQTQKVVVTFSAVYRGFYSHPNAQNNLYNLIYPTVYLLIPQIHLKSYFFWDFLSGPYKSRFTNKKPVNKRVLE